MNYKYQLEKYSGRNSRYTCPACGKPHRFTRYIDTGTGEHLAPHVGRCNREVECGYHYKPKEYFSTTPVIASAARQLFSAELISPKKNHSIRETASCLAVTKKEEPMHRATPQHTQHFPSWEGRRGGSVHNAEQVSATLVDYDNNHLIQYLSNTLGPSATGQLITRYRIGTHHHWRGSTVYWYINKAQQVCSGKVMLYNPATGKRVKEPFNHVTWMHSLLGMEGFVRQPCFFGEHLLVNTTLPVSIVESEKTALVASHYLPGSIWLATGGLSSLNIEHCRRVLKGRKLTLFPDAGAYDRWLPIAAQLPNCNISRMIEYYHSLPGDDLADMLAF